MSELLLSNTQALSRQIMPQAPRRVAFSPATDAVRACKVLRLFHNGGWGQHVAVRQQRRHVRVANLIDVFDHALRVCVQRWRTLSVMVQRLLRPLLLVNTSIYILVSGLRALQDSLACLL